MKKNIAFLLIGLSFVILVNAWASSSDPVLKSVEHPMLAAFQASEAYFSDAKVQGWAEINHDFLSVAALNDLGNKVEEVLGKHSVLTRKEISDEGFNSLEISGRAESGGNVSVIFQSLTNEREENGTYLVVNISDTRGVGEILSIREKIMDIFTEFDRTPEINELLVGYVEGQLPAKDCRNKIKNIFQAAGGKLFGGIEESGYISKTGFVSNLPAVVEVNGKQVNMQVAASFNEIDCRTYIYIGSPLVCSDY
ncbi:MAG: YwmB family TATA-box binding protein [Desulfitobacteriaceae bacterium]|nr:YwmB family TATA-box binding protein [Desulfitobacteriaceae bacterium]